MDEEYDVIVLGTGLTMPLGVLVLEGHPVSAGCPASLKASVISLSAL
ncbi:GDI1 isoform 15 [Pan troglodytes]|uniref:GDP dissociation inhibitor 1 n=3 Tax=Hominidae TaxID=9604 RepID=F8WCU0_HUMAN|nr:GDI1 isoform 15 [Pan troglodytes]PNJ09531.1 GDI1 isoform 6 [Pongo abelii]